MRGRLTRNIGWKIGSVLLALALWFHLATEKTYQRSFTARLEIRGLPDGLVVDRVEPSETVVSFTGSGKQLLKLMLSGGVKIRLDLSQIAGPGVHTYRASLADLHGTDVSIFKRVSFSSGDRYRIYVKPKT